MALGLTFSNGKPATMARGKYTTRNNRLVEIHGSHIESGTTGGVAWSKKMWDGTLFAANMRDIESTHTWSDEGGYLHQEGVGNEFDLRSVISQEPEPEPAPLHHSDPTLLESQIHMAAILKMIEPEMRGGESAPERVAHIMKQRDDLRHQVRELLYYFGHKG
jgi:hypothetical protein